MTGTKDKHKSRKSSSNRALWVIFFFIVVAVTVVIFVAVTRKTNSQSSSVGTTTVQRDNLTVSVTASGSIRAHKSLQYACQVQSRGLSSMSSGIKILSIVPAGTIITQEDVENGKVLVELDSSPLEDRLITEQMSLATADETVKSAKESYDIQVIDNENSIADGQLRIEFALLDLQKYLGEELAGRLINLTEGMISDINDTTATLALMHVAQIIQEVQNDPNILAGSSAGQQLKRFQDDIVLAEGNLTTQEERLAGTEKLYDANFVSPLELKQDRLTLQNRRFALESAQISLDLFLDYDLPKDAKQYLSNYIEAKRNLDRIYAQCRSQLAQASSRLGTAQTRYDAQAEQVRQLEEQIKNCTIRAKAPGLVVYGSGSSSDIYRYIISSMSSGVIAEGETVSEGQVLISIPDTSAWIVEVNIHETDVDKVRPGQSAAIIMDAFPDRTLKGTVTEVAPLPDQQLSILTPDRKVYKTLVMIDGSHDFLRSQMSCKVEILIERLEDVMVVPIIAVANRGGKKICWILNSSGNQEQRAVQTGAFNDMYVQVIGGLQEGDQVLLNPPLITELATTTVDVLEEVEMPPPAASEGGPVQIGQTAGGVNEVEGDEPVGLEMRGEQGGIDMNSEEIQKMMEKFGVDMDSEEMKQKMEQMMKQFGTRGSG